ncbi:MAG: hypothetical protein JWQ23_4422 [Herminiimonas sp.]|nr:hypothetical protein [Herminiimonas sp.]
MTTLNTIGTQFGFEPEYLASSFRMRLGRRELVICRDFRRRFYAVHPLLDCSAGTEPGHLELVLGRKWLIILGKAR